MRGKEDEQKWERWGIGGYNVEEKCQEYRSLFFWDKVSLCSPKYPGPEWAVTHRDSHASITREVKLKNVLSYPAKNKSLKNKSSIMGHWCQYQGSQGKWIPGAAGKPA